MEVVIVVVLTMAAGGIFFKVLNNLGSFEEEFGSHEIKVIADSTSGEVIVTGEFKVEKQCVIAQKQGGTIVNTYETSLSKFMNQRIPQGSYDIEVECCNLKNECKNETFASP